MSEGRKVRIPFIPLELRNSDLSEVGELLVDTTYEELYIKTTNGSLVNLPTDDRIETLIKNEVGLLLDGVDIDGNTLEKLNLLTEEINVFMENNTKKITSPNIYNILRMFRYYRKDDKTVLEFLNGKMDKSIVGGEMVEVNFTDDLLIKLNSITPEANNYRHPVYTQCDIKANSIITVNGKSGILKIVKNDIKGLEKVHPKANNYKHPEIQVCNYIPDVISVNSKSGSVYLNNTDIGLSDIHNYAPAILDDHVTMRPNKYTILKSAKDYIEKTMGF